MFLVRGALKNPYAVSVAALLFLVAGGVSLMQIPVDILPVFKSPGVLVMTFYSGMPANVIERNITTRMERWCCQATGVTRVESKSMVGVSIVRIYFRDDIEPAAALTEVNSLALSTLPTLPPGTLPPIVRPFDPTATLPLSILSVSCPGGELGETQLQDLARIDLRNQLGGLPGVIAPTAFGGRERTIMVYVRPDDMEARQMSPLDVVRALRNYNAMLTAGTAKFGDEEVQLDSNAMVRDVADLNELPIRAQGDRQVFLKDIGEARDASAIQTALVRINGKSQVYVPIYRQQGASSLTVVDSVKKELPLMQTRAPEGVELDVVMDQSVYVRQAIDALVHEAVLGAMLAAGMILVFLGDFRTTLIATLSIPLAVLAALAAIAATGNTINVMTLGGLALAIGPLVDNAIVVLENTHRHLTLGKSPAQAAEDGAGEVAQPALVATLSTIIVLVPLALMPGMGKFLFRPLALAVAFSMIASLFLALTFVPARCAAWLKGHGGEHPGDDPHPAGWGRRLHHRVELFLTWMTRRYEALLAWSLQRRALFLTCISALFLASLGLLPFIGQEFFPQVDSGQLTVFVRCPTGTKLERTSERVDKFERFLRQEIPPGDLRMIVSELGVTTNWSAAYTPNAGPQDAVVKIQLTDERSKTAQQFASDLRRKFQELQQHDPDFADLRINFDTGGIVSAALNYGASSPIDIQVNGGSTQAMNRKAREIRDRVATIPGAVDVRIQQRLDYPQMMIEIDRKKAEMLELDVRDVFQTVTTALNSSIQVDRNFWIDPKSGNQYFIAVQYEEKPETKLEEVRSISIRGPRSAESVKLGSLVNFRRLDSGPAEAIHDNLANIISVMVNTDGRDIGGIAGDIQKKLRDVELPKGMVVRMSGEFQRMQESFGNMGFGLALASVLVYLLMVAQFRSWLSPLIIMFAVPLGLIGVLVTLFLTRTTLNVQSLMGVIFMVGIVVANATLLVDFANRQRELGASVYKAITTAAAIRLRPILMTFLATFLGLLPMALALGKGSEANAPLGRAVVGGLLASTVLTLFVVPIMYTILNKDVPHAADAPAAEPAPTHG
ncbi:MAG: efflux RND transporter permease subunit [Planctomycetia bacterium]|nr:efflux RND transporter permease subunit [Planctomycetia bacterium]